MLMWCGVNLQDNAMMIHLHDKGWPLTVYLLINGKWVDHIGRRVLELTGHRKKHLCGIISCISSGTKCMFFYQVRVNFL